MVKKKNNGKKEQRSFDKIHDNFANNLASLDAFMSNVTPVVERQERANDRATAKFIKQARKILGIPKVKSKNKTGSQDSERATSEQMKQISKLVGELPPVLSISQQDVLFRSAFVMLVSFFDFLMSDLIRYYYHKYPDILSSKELQLTLKELKELGCVNDAVDVVIDKEADNILYDSLKNQRNYLSKVLKVDTKDDIVNWSGINEAMERRNVVVHNNCIINRRYLISIDRSVAPEPEKSLKEGIKLHIYKPYFQKIFEEVCVSGFILIQCCWRKWEKEDVSSADDQLNMDIYNFLEKEKWVCAQRVGFFAKECKVNDQASRLTLDINYCQSLKWQGKQKELEEELSKFDISALSPKFALGVYALKSDRDGFYNTIENAIKVDELPKEAFFEWPLFQEWRKDVGYKDRIEAVFSSVSDS